MPESDEVFSVVSLAGEPRCWFCGERPPAIDGRWCSARCRAGGRQMLATSPRPEVIDQRAAKIRSTWSEKERIRRRYGSCVRNLGWRPPIVAEADLYLEPTRDRV